MPLSVLLLDEQGIVIEVNPAVREMLHKLEGEIEGQHISFIIPEFSDFVPTTYYRQTTPGHLEIFDNVSSPPNLVKASSLMESIYYRHLNQNEKQHTLKLEFGAEKPTWVKISIHRDEEDDGDIYILTLFDVTESYEHLAQIKRLNQSLEAKVNRRTQNLHEANINLKKTLANLEQTQKHLLRERRLNSLNMFVMNAAHIFNTPLGVLQTGISSIAELFSKTRLKLERNEIKRSDLKTLFSQTDSGFKAIENKMRFLIRLLKRLQLFSLENVSSSCAETALPDFFQQTVTEWQLERGSKVNVKIDCVADTVRLKQQQLKLILSELLDNVRQHGVQTNEEQSRVEILVEIQKDNLHFSIRDDGEGIEHDAIEHLFDPFVYFGNHGQESVGLGLTLVQNIVKSDLGGQVDIESSPGKGFMVNISFPLQEQTLAPTIK